MLDLQLLMAHVLINIAMTTLQTAHQDLPSLTVHVVFLTVPHPVHHRQAAQPAIQDSSYTAYGVYHRLLPIILGV